MDTSGLDAVQATAEPIHHIGSVIFMSPETFARAAEWGWSNPFAFYFAGRGGVLGEVDAGVVASSFGWFNPDFVTGMWGEGISVSGARAAAERMFEAHALWGRDHLRTVDVERFVELGERLVARAEGAGLPLFVGWREHRGVEDAPGRAAQLIQVLREWRGANHLVCTTAVGLSPLEAILTNEGEGQAKFFAWPAPFPEVSGVRELHDEAERMTDALCAKEFDRILTPAERTDFVTAVGAIRASQS